MGIKDGWAKVKKAWSVFRGAEQQPESYSSVGASSFFAQQSPTTRYKERSLVATIQNRIAIDAAQTKLVHSKVDENGRFEDTIPSGLNNVLNYDANIDQSGFAFKLHAFQSLLADGVIALVPYRVEPSLDADEYDIREMRVGSVVEWFPRHVRVSLYNDETGKRQEIIIPKSKVSIVQNPFYSVMNERNSLVQMLTNKYRILDLIDQRLGSTKMDLIIQLPYPFKGVTREEQARKRQDEISRQLTDTKYGIAYIDGSEKVIQLNRPIENNLLAQIEYMEKSLYTQLSITPEILNGTASPEQMLNYFNRTVEPCITAVIDELTRKHVRGKDEKGIPTHTDQTICMFREPFKLVPPEKVAELSDKLTRNEIATSNEMRAIIGWKPSKDPKADELRNANLNHPDEKFEQQPLENDETKNDGGNQNGRI